MKRENFKNVFSVSQVKNTVYVTVYSDKNTPYATYIANSAGELDNMIKALYSEEKPYLEWHYPKVKAPMNRDMLYIYKNEVYIWNTKGTIRRYLRDIIKRYMEDNTWQCVTTAWEYDPTKLTALSAMMFYMGIEGDVTYVHDFWADHVYFEYTTCHGKNVYTEGIRVNGYGVKHLEDLYL